MSEYKYKEYITDREGTTTGYKEIVVPNKVVEQIRAEVIEEIMQYMRLHRKYALHTVDDFVFYYPMYEWLEQLKEQK